MGEAAAKADFDSPTRKAEITLRLSEFEVPPIHDCLIIGRQAPVGSEGVRRMMEAVSPGQFEVIKLEHPEVEALVVRKSLLKMLPVQRLAELLTEEFSRLSTARSAMKVQAQVVVEVSRELDLA